jgi:hypothetical protein
MDDKRDSRRRVDEHDKVIDEARRRLLAKALYVPPAVIGALALSQEGCQVASCNPSACNPGGCNPDNSPCQPNGQGCGPDTGCAPGQGCNPGSCNPSGNPCNPNG